MTSIRTTATSLLLVLALALAACTSRQLMGGSIVIGAAVGGSAGYAIDDDSAAPVAGAVVGALFGAVIGLVLALRDDSSSTDPKQCASC